MSTVLALFYSENTRAQYEWSNISIPANAGSGKTWDLVESLSDDFSYSKSFGRGEYAQRSNFGPQNQWNNFYHNAWDGPGRTFWDTSNVAVDGDNLVITAGQTNETSKGGSYGVASGCVTSNAKVTYPVYVESSLSVANISLASCFWLLSPDDTEEIDIIENYGGVDFFKNFTHISHHSFVRNPFTDYQPRDWNSWYAIDEITNAGGWGEFCWNGGNRRYMRMGVNWIGPKHWEYYIDGALVRVMYYNAMATKINGTWEYTYYNSVTQDANGYTFPTNGSDGYSLVTTHTTSSNYNFSTLQEASNASNGYSVIDTGWFQGGDDTDLDNNGVTVEAKGFSKSMDIVINIESQTWLLNNTPPGNHLSDPARNQMKVDWVRVYKPVAGSGGETPTPTPPTTGNNQTPFGGTASAIPGTINSVNFDNGGPGVAYNDTTNGNQGSGARQNTNVDTENRANGGNVGWIANGEWLEYTVNVATAGNYTINAQVASTNSNGAFHIEFNGNDVTGRQSVNSTGNWGNFVNKTISNVTLTAGQQVMRVFMDRGSFNLGSISFTASNSNSNNGNSGGGNSGDGSNSVVIEAEDFTTTGGNFNDNFVPFGVGRTNSTINYVNNGDWAEYSISIPQDGNYEITYAISSPNTGSTIGFGMGTSIWNTTTVPNNGNWDDYQNLTASATANFTAGNHVVRLTAGAQNWTWNLDKFTLQRVGNMTTRANKLNYISDEATNTNFTIIPSAVQRGDNVTILTGDSSLASTIIAIYNIYGQKLYTTTTTSNTAVEVNTSTFTSGIYLVVINGKKSKKLIVQ